MSAREHVHALVDALDDGALAPAASYLAYLRDSAAAERYTFATAPDDDEPITVEDEAAVAEALEDFDAGHSVSHVEARRLLLGKS